METAVVHEWLQARAGSEQVFAALAKILPAADLFALTMSPGIDFGLGGRPVRTTFLDRAPLRDRRALTLPLMPLAWRSVASAENYDLVITSHHAFASGNRLVRTGGAHLCYVHTPARYVWFPELDARGRGVLPSLTRAALKRIDLHNARGVTSFAANSRTVADRIQAIWSRPSRVIHPPVDTDFFTPAGEKCQRDASHSSLEPGFLLGLGRWVPYKNHAKIIEIADEAGVPVVIAGSGPEEASIRSHAAAARVPVEVLRNPSRETVRELLRASGALVFPTVEDFGIVPVEAQACGTPVLALAAGGALETVLHTETGVLVKEDTVSAFAHAVPSVLKLGGEGCRSHALGFSQDVFRGRVQEWITEDASA